MNSVQIIEFFNIKRDYLGKITLLLRYEMATIDIQQAVRTGD